MEGVVPVAVEAVPGDGQGGDLVVADLDAGGVLVGVEFRVHGQAGLGSGRRDALDDDFMAGQGPAAPVHGDVGEQPVLDPVPLRRAGRQVADGDGQTSLSGEPGEFGLPGAGAIPVGAAGIGGDQQSAGRRVGGPSGSVPPAADRLDGERTRTRTGCRASWPKPPGTRMSCATGSATSPLPRWPTRSGRWRRTCRSPTSWPRGLRHRLEAHRPLVVSTFLNVGTATTASTGTSTSTARSNWRSRPPASSTPPVSTTATTPTPRRSPRTSARPSTSICSTCAWT